MSAAAARLGDPISHSSAMGGLLTGLAVGAGVALAGVAVVTTGGLAAAPIMATVAAVGAGASAGAGIGQMVGGNNTSETGVLTTGSPNVRINGQSAARASADFAVCSKHHHGRNPVASGSDGVRINGYPAARVEDQTECGGTISAGSENVRIGGSTVRTRTINPEVPPWLQWTIVGVGLASTGYFLAVAPVITTGGIVGGFAGEKGGKSLGRRLYGEGSTGQAYMALGGAVIGGGIGAQGAQSFNSRYVISSHGLGSNLGNIRINRRTNEFTGILRNKPVKLKNVNVRPLEFVKRSREEQVVLRNQFQRKVKKDFLKELGASNKHRAALKKRGMSDSDLRLIENGYSPNGWQVHHNKPLEDSGNNDFSNLTLIKNDPYHQSITNYQRFVTSDMKPGDVKIVDWPFIDAKYYP